MAPRANQAKIRWFWKVKKSGKETSSSLQIRSGNTDFASTIPCRPWQISWWILKSLCVVFHPNAVTLGSSSNHILGWERAAVAITSKGRRYPRTARWSGRDHRKTFWPGFNPGAAAKVLPHAREQEFQHRPKHGATDIQLQPDRIWSDGRNGSIAGLYC